MKRIGNVALGLLVGAAAWASAAAVVPGQTAFLPVETFFRPAKFPTLRLSPTGKYLASVTRVNGVRTLVVMSSEDKKITAVFDFGHQNQEIGEFGWLNDERVFATMVKKVGPLARPQPTGVLFAGNADGSHRRQLLPKPGKAREMRSDLERPYNIISLMPDDARNISISLFERGASSVYKLNVYTGHRSRITVSPLRKHTGTPILTSFGADHSGRIRIATGKDEDLHKVLLYYRKDNRAPWRKLDERDENEGGFSFVAFDKADQNFYVEAGGENLPRGIYLYDPSSGAMRMVHALKGDADVMSYLFDSDYGHRGLIGLVREPGYMVKEYLDRHVPAARRLRSLDKALPDKYVDVVDYTRDGHLALVSARSDKEPGEYYLFDTKKFKLQFLLAVKPWIDPQKMAAMQPISFQARDGLEIRGYLTLPRGQGKRLPMVLVVHGGPYGIMDAWGFNDEAQFLANRGYAVLQINYRGSGGRGHHFIYDHYREMGAEMQNDLTDGTKWAIQQGIADPHRICIYGGSYGGYAALMAVVKEPDLYQCAIPYAGVYDINIQAHESDTTKSKAGRSFLRRAWNAYDGDFVHARSGLFHLDKLKAALFLVHGEADPRVPFENYLELTKALDARHYPYESLTKKHEPHGFQNEQNRYELYAKLATFLDQHIGGQDSMLSGAVP